MAVDPLIARGVQPLDMTNALIGVAGLRQRDRALAQDQQVIDFRQNALLQAQQQQEDDDAEWEQAYAAKDWGRMARLDAQTTRILWDREQASKPQRDVRQVGQALVEVPAEGDPRELYRAPQQPQQYAPETFSEFVAEDGTVHLIGSRGTIRPTQLRGGAKGPVAAPELSPQAAETRMQSAENVLASITDAEDMAGFFTTGLVGSVLANVPGSSAYDLRQTVDTIKANIGFDRLQRMREESKTGGALGQVAVQELDMLQKTIDSLDPNQSEKGLRVALTRVRNQYERAMGAYERMLNQGGSPTSGLPSVESRVQSYYGSQP